jgi:hypothetical protein
MKHYCPTVRRNNGRPLKRLLETWDRNGSTSGPTPWQIYVDDHHHHNHDDVLIPGTRRTLKVYRRLCQEWNADQKAHTQPLTHRAAPVLDAYRT